MFSIGDKISHPMHGAGVITDIVECPIGNDMQPFYLATMTCGAMTVLIPCSTAEAIGVRYIISSSEAEELMNSCPDLTFTFNDNWSKRYRENMDKIKSGNLQEVAGVIKALVLRDREKSLSTGERKLLGMAKNILVSEIVLSTGRTIPEVENYIIASIV